VPLAREEAAIAREAQRKVRLQDAELEGRQRLWRLFLLVTLGVLLLETWVAGRTLRAEGRGASVEGRGAESNSLDPRPSDFPYHVRHPMRRGRKTIT
jgi:hypothetical protein